MINYVLGFLFSEQGDRVALLRRTKPEWQAGLLNGIGGKIDVDESSETAMSREFQEEAGIAGFDWKMRTVIAGPDYRVFIYSAFSDRVDEVMTMEDQEVLVIPTYPLPRDIIPNLSWIIPLLLDKNLYIPMPFTYPQ